MRSQAMFFKARAGEKLADVQLQKNLAGFKDKFVGMRARAVDAYGINGGADFEALRDAGQMIRDRVLENLDVWLELFEEKATQRGATVLWARDGREICEHVIAIAKRHDVKKVT
ncbi:MAG: L-lactate dehydrogenase complex protein LldF, partial [Pseudomonadota bacterium]|nr:L-lactate dehydrogenase complex protein LldF [Pseudomonadota bacterium]